MGGKGGRAQDNMDLFPVSWLERWCPVTWGDTPHLITPRGRKLTLDSWDLLPSMTKEQLDQALRDLPCRSVRGRSGRSAVMKVAATGIILGSRSYAARLSHTHHGRYHHGRHAARKGA